MCSTNHTWGGLPGNTPPLPPPVSPAAVGPWPPHLAEDFAQVHHGDAAGLDDGLQHGARPHRRQLVGVPCAPPRPPAPLTLHSTPRPATADGPPPGLSPEGLSPATRRSPPPPRGPHVLKQVAGGRAHRRGPAGRWWRGSVARRPAAPRPGAGPACWPRPPALHPSAAAAASGTRS